MSGSLPIFNLLGDREFMSFRDIIYREAGIKLSDMKKALVQARLSRRIRILRLESYAAYHDYLMDNFETEKIEFINAITTNKTEFFREHRHFDFLTQTVLPLFERTGESELRVWSAGCSTGEEAYSLGIVLLEYFQGRSRPGIKILATDIDTNVLEKAALGVYSENLTEKLSPDLIHKYFLLGTGEHEGTFKMKDALREIIFFRRLNLLDEHYPMKKLFFIIFCRNVIIYFDRKTQKDLFGKLHHYLHDTGYLFIGHSENITGLTSDLKLIGNTVYQRTRSGG